MKKLILFFVLLTAHLVQAQPPAYDDLRILHADKNYEKLIKVAEKYTLDDKTKADPVAHMWFARGLYQMSISGTTDEKYKNAYKESLGEFGKAIKLDKSGEVQTEYATYFDEARNSLVENIENELNTPKKAAAWITKYYKFDANSVGAKFLEGACKFADNDKGGANTCWKDADAKLSKVSNFESWNEADKRLLMLGIMKTAESYAKMKQTDKAKTLLGKVAQWYEGNEEFKEVYDKYVN